MSLFGMISTAASLPYTALALESFRAATEFRQGDRFLLIDNDGSAAETESLLRELPIESARVANPQPLGFAANFNSLIRIAVSERSDLFLLNNDLVFTPGWRELLQIDNPAITSPLSNREVQYASTVVVPTNSNILELFLLRPSHTLDEYLEHRAAFTFMADTHRQKVSGYNPVFVLPFFCSRIHQTVLETVGLLDEAYGRGGGEDFDYCLRAHLAGFPVLFALGSLILHFGGKSSWSGVETEVEQQRREATFRGAFEAKWGPDLFALILKEDYSVVSSDGALSSLEQEGRIREVIEALIQGRHIDVRCWGEPDGTR